MAQPLPTKQKQQQQTGTGLLGAGHLRSWLELGVLFLVGYVAFGVLMSINMTGDSSATRLLGYLYRMGGPKQPSGLLPVIYHDPQLSGRARNVSLGAAINTNSKFFGVPTSTTTTTGVIPEQGQLLSELGKVMTPVTVSIVTGQPKTRTRIAILVPFRNRFEQLKIFVPEMQSFLSKQNIDFKIVIIEQTGNAKFNRGSLINVAFVEAFKHVPQDYFDCVVIHDIDLLPTMAGNSYDCNKEATLGAIQLSSAIDKYNWDLPYMAAGGVNMIRSSVVVRANGFSNRFFGWGGEDNDFDGRMKSIGVVMKQRSKELGRYKSIKVGHYRSPGKAEDRFTLLRFTDKLQQHEGINSLRYRLLKRADTNSLILASVEMWLSEDPDVLEKLGVVPKKAR